jgi:hypothetical protein
MIVNTLCNCGEPAKYILTTVSGDTVGSCNKYKVCKSYSKIRDELCELKTDYNTLLECAQVLLTYREGTSHYYEAEDYINNWCQKVKYD